jgi:hypothetical protein
MQAVRDKIFSTGTFLNIFTLSRLLDTLGNSIKTDITPEEMESFLSLVRTLDTKNIATVVIDAWKKESLLRVSHIPTPNGNAFVLLPRTGNWKEIQALAHHVFSLENLKQERERIIAERSSLLILSSSDQGDLANTLQQFLIDELGFDEVTISVNLEDVPKHSTISENADGRKPYSQNALLSRFDLSKESSSERIHPRTDFVLKIGEDMEENAFIGDGASMAGGSSIPRRNHRKRNDATEIHFHSIESYAHETHHRPGKPGNTIRADSTQRGIPSTRFSSRAFRF